MSLNFGSWYDHQALLSRRDLLRATALSTLPAFAGASGHIRFPDPEKRRAAQSNTPLPPNRNYRTMEWECHTPPSANFDIDVDAAMHAAADCGAECMMLYAQDHWGYAFYTSDVGVRHPNLKDDLLGREVSAAKKLGMAVTCYYSVRLNHQCVERHPDWGLIDVNGTHRRARWYMTCVDGPYRQYMLGMIDELFSRYEFDQIFLDTYGLPFAIYNTTGTEPFCYCPHTEQAWNQQYPGDPYRAGFSTREGWDRRFNWLQQRTLISLLDEATRTVRKHRPKAVISLNGGPERFPNELMQRVSYIYEEPLTTDSGISIGSILMRGWGRPDYQAGVFSRQGYLDVYPGSLPRVKADGLMLQNARVCIVGNAPIIGGLDGKGFSTRWFATAKETWQDVRNVDALLDGIHPVLSTAMLYSESTRVELSAQKRPTDFRDSTVGALEIITYAGRPVESVPEFRITPEYLAKFETLVLPEVEVLSSAAAKTIQDWVLQGGTLVATGRSGLLDENHRSRSNFALAEVLGVDFVSEERKYIADQNTKNGLAFISTYLESTGHPLISDLAGSTVGLSGSFLNLQLRGATELMRYRLPFMVQDLAHDQYFNWGPPPPGPQTGGAAVTYHSFGKGQAMYFGVPLFQNVRQQLFWIRRGVPQILRTLTPEPILELDTTDLPEHVHATFFWDKDDRTILVQILNSSELLTGGRLMDLPYVDLRINPRKLNVRAAKVVWPVERAVTVRMSEGNLHVRIASPGRYTALYLGVA